MKTAILKFLASLLKKENMQRSGIMLIALLAIVSVLAYTIGSDDAAEKPQQTASTSQKQTAKSDSVKSTTASTGSKRPGSQSASRKTASSNTATSEIKPVTSLRKSSFRDRIGPPTKRIAGR